MKSAFVAIVGRPSSGKSTFINRVSGNKVSIVSPIPQTTRNRIRGIYNGPDGASQLVFVDTPGFHSSEKKFNAHLGSVVHTAIGECGLVLYIVDITRSPGAEEQAILSVVADSKKPVVVALNKTDSGKGFRDEHRRELEAGLPDASVFEISARTGDGIDGLIARLVELAEEGEQMYPEEFYTDQPPDFRIAEIIREKAMNNTRDEVPHSLYVELSDLEMVDEGKVLWVRGFIYVERESQKGILVGKGGEMIRKILGEAQQDIDGLFPYDVELDIRVKVDPNWRNNDKRVKRLIE